MRTPWENITINFARAPPTKAHLFDIPKYKLPEIYTQARETYEGPINIYQGPGSNDKRSRELKQAVKSEKEAVRASTSA